MARVYQLKTLSPSRLGIDYVASLNDEQRAVVMAPRGPLLVLAGAGSGKTRALTYRVARLIDTGTPPEAIMVLTFTNRAAKEMMERVSELVGPQGQRVFGGTFHHVANAILRRHAEAIGYGPNFTILDRDDAREVMSAAVGDAKVDVRQGRFPKSDVLIDIASFAVNTQTAVREVVASRSPRFFHLTDDIAKVCRAYIERKASMNLMDFDDLLMNWKILLEEGGTVGAQIAASTQAILVDEYQDTNALQGQIVDLMGAPHRNVMAVGDDAQCIYGFRGAEVRNMLDFQQRYPGASVLSLTLNYRSTPQVLSLANACLSRAKESFHTKLRAVRPDGALPALIPCRDVYQQAEFVAARILEMRDEGVPLEDIAVLYRAHSHAMEIQVELTRRGIPFTVRSGMRFFEQQHIKDVLAHLKLLYNPDDELSFRRALKLQEGVGNATTDQLWHKMKELAGSSMELVHHGLLSTADDATGRRAKPGIHKFVRLLGALSHKDVHDKPGEMIRVVLEDFYAEHLLKNFPNARERQDDVSQLAEYAGSFETLETFLSDLALVQSFSSEEVVAADTPDEKVTLSSVHQAKGLEWSRCFLVWLNDGSFPSDLALRDIAGEDEERRLFYVAVTRAKDELMLCHPQTSRARDASMVLHRRSRFVEELPPPYTDAQGIERGHYEMWQLEVVEAARLASPAPVLGLDGKPELVLLEGGRELGDDDEHRGELDA